VLTALFSYEVFGMGVRGRFAIYYGDGTVKWINIREGAPPISLGYLSRNISDISRTLDWQPSTKPVVFNCSFIAPNDE
jgi:hypothetical protein